MSKEDFLFKFREKTTSGLLPVQQKSFKLLSSAVYLIPNRRLIRKSGISHIPNQETARNEHANLMVVFLNIKIFKYFSFCFD